MNNMTSKAQQGFSLINGMISLAVIGVLFGSVVPTVTALVMQSRTATEYTEIAKAFTLARSTAVTRRSDIQVSAEHDGEWSKGLIIWEDQNANGKPEQHEILYSLPGLQTSANLSETNGKSGFYFTKQGFAKSEDRQPVAFHYESEWKCSLDRTIQIKYTGRVAVQEPDCL